MARRVKHRIEKTLLLDQIHQKIMTCSITPGAFSSYSVKKPMIRTVPMRNTLASLLSLFCLIGSMTMAEIALAKTYKWVDENGVTQYSSTPPPTGDFEALKGPSKPAIDPAKAQGEMDKRLEAFDKRKEEAENAKKESDAAAAKASQDKKNCALAKKNLNLLQTKVRIKIKDKDGKIHYQTDDERTANIKRAKEAIKSFCK